MIYVVPSLKAKEKLQCEGKAWAESQGFAYVPRGKRTIQDLMDEYGEDFLVYSSRGPQIDRPEGSHFFSLNMAELRIQNLRKGQRDHLLEALMGVKEYDLRPAAAQPPISVLDCTCGFGADAAVASFGLPAGSRVDALEVSPLLEAVTAWGFSYFVHKKDDVTAALRRISLRCGDYRDYLLSDDGPVYDVLYFDPMFQRPVPARPGHHGTRRSDAGPHRTGAAESPAPGGHQRAGFPPALPRFPGCYLIWRQIQPHWLCRIGV